jgi:hypothetical protein
MNFGSIAAGPCQHNHSWFWVPQDSLPYFLSLTIFFRQSGKLLMALATTVILSQESCQTHDHILLPYDSEVMQLHKPYFPVLLALLM